MEQVIKHNQERLKDQFLACDATCLTHAIVSMFFPLNTGGIEMRPAAEITIKDENDHDVLYKLPNGDIVEAFLMMVTSDTTISIKRAPQLRTDISELDYNQHNDEKTEPVVDALSKPPPIKLKNRLYNKSIVISSRVRYLEGNAKTKVQKLNSALINIKQQLEYKYLSVQVESLYKPSNFVDYKKRI